MACHLRIGLTGGIGAGKSTVAEIFASLGVPVFDADLVAREVVEPGAPALAEVVGAFGPGVLGPDGRLDRAHLRTRIFADDTDLIDVYDPELILKGMAVIHARNRR